MTDARMPVADTPHPIARRGLLFVISSPSGAGKTTLSRQLLDADDRIEMSVSATTRPPRQGEVDGKDYHFTAPDRFAAMVEEGAFLEHAEVFGNRYGTPKAPVMAAVEEGRDVLFDIDWQGAQQLAEVNPSDLVTVFILPPSRDVLEERLNKRAQDSAEVVRARMAKADSEISHYAEYDYVVVNRDIETAAADMKAILRSERLRRNRQTGLRSFVSTVVGS